MKRFLIIIMVLSLLILPACSSNDQNTSSNTEVNEYSDIEDQEKDESSGSEINQLAINIFLLEESEFAISLEQAEEMLVLWQVANSTAPSPPPAQQWDLSRTR